MAESVPCRNRLPFHGNDEFAIEREVLCRSDARPYMGSAGYLSGASNPSAAPTFSNARRQMEIALASPLRTLQGGRHRREGWSRTLA
jgi:hypothetical protein